MAKNSQGDRAVAAVQIPRELPSIYRWVTNDVLGTPSSLDQQYLDELKLTGVLFGGGDLERRYRVEAAWRGERRLLNQASVAPSQLHPNAWSSIHCFELVTEFLELPQDPELSLEGDGLFPLYWSDQAGFDVVPVTYQRLNGDQRDTADILLHLFSKINLAPKSLLSNPGEARRAIVEMASNDVTLSRLRNLLRLPQAGSVPQARVAPAASGPSSLGRASTLPVIPIPENRATPEGGSSNKTGRGQDHLVDISSPLREEELRRPSPNKRPAEEGVVGSKTPRVSEGGSREFSAMDRSFDALGFIAANLLGPRAQEALRDYDPVESVRWAEWAMLRVATILKSVEPCFTVADEVERRNAKLLGDLKVLDLQKLVVKEEKADVVTAKLKAEEELKSAETKLETLAKEKD
ncbi:hypothetical protein PIB30_067127 [Stylosanthes scabra]|uniref:Uncharacterized protein n=1 Tax=Stylosanthes scabra TaxID=79078 RepID=A0ABU6TMQ6_9FABA|nr:hypothetical protein [Stylosanthes scabra]